MLTGLQTMPLIGRLSLHAPVTPPELFNPRNLANPDSPDFRRLEALLERLNADGQANDAAAATASSSIAYQSERFRRALEEALNLQITDRKSVV